MRRHFAVEEVVAAAVEEAEAAEGAEVAVASERELPPLNLVLVSRLWLWLWLKTRSTPVPYLTTSSVAPAPCSARARPCLDVWRGEPLLVQRIARFAGPRASDAHVVGVARGRVRYGVFSHLWLRGWFVWDPAPAGVRPVLPTRGLRAAVLRP